MISVGAQAPDFTLSTQYGALFHLGSFRGKASVLLLFLPAAFTPICTTELPELAELQNKFWLIANTIVAAITVDPPNVLDAWSRECGSYNVPVLSDSNPIGSVSQSFGVYLPEDRTSDRATVIVGKDGTVKYAESVGRFGKRSIQTLLSIASMSSKGGNIQNAGAAMPVNVPILYSRATCHHCQTVKKFLASTGLSRYVIVRDVDKDSKALKELTRSWPSAGVPTLIWKGHVIAGDANEVIDALRSMFHV